MVEVLKDRGKKYGLLCNLKYPITMEKAKIRKDVFM